MLPSGVLKRPLRPSEGAVVRSVGAVRGPQSFRQLRPARVWHPRIVSRQPDHAAVCCRSGTKNVHHVDFRTPLRRHRIRSSILTRQSPCGMFALNVVALIAQKRFCPKVHPGPLPEVNPERTSVLCRSSDGAGTGFPTHGNGHDNHRSRSERTPRDGRVTPRGTGPVGREPSRNPRLSSSGSSLTLNR